MAIISITTTAGQDAALQRLTDRYNTANGTALTSAQWLTTIVMLPALQSYVAQALSEDSAAVRAAWEAAGPVLRAAVKSSLGVV